MTVDVERNPWDRLPTETSTAYTAFRLYRDAGPRRRLSDATSTTLGQAKRWSTQWSWPARAVAWDDEVHRVEDLDRLDSIRSMHSNHARAARVLQQFAMSALSSLDAGEVSAADVVRLLELGTKLERATLTTSVDDLAASAGLSRSDDPWQRITEELAASLPGLP